MKLHFFGWAMHNGYIYILFCTWGCIKHNLFLWLFAALICLAVCESYMLLYLALLFQVLSQMCNVLYIHRVIVIPTYSVYSYVYTNTSLLLPSFFPLKMEMILCILVERNKKGNEGNTKECMYEKRGTTQHIFIFLNIRSVSSTIGCKRDKIETGRGGQF